MANKTEFIPLIRIEKEVKLRLQKEADIQGRTLTNYVQYALKQLSERLTSAK